METKIDRWSFVSRSRNDLYSAPEQMTHCLSGYIQEKDTGEIKRICSSRIKKLEVIGNRRVVITKSGSRYILGTIDPRYRSWLKENHPNWDWKNPLKKVET